MDDDFIDDEFIDDEFIDDIIDDSDDIDSICLNCGKEDRIPCFIYDEYSKKRYHLKIKKKVSTLQCGFCGKETVIPKKFFKN